MNKPEPLTKEKIDEKVVWNRFWSIIRKLPIMKMRRKHDKEVVGLQVAFEGEILHIQRDVKSAVEWLLKEIDKKYNEISDKYFELSNNPKTPSFMFDDIVELHEKMDCLEMWKDWFKDLIKKAFGGLIEE